MALAAALTGCPPAEPPTAPVVVHADPAQLVTRYNQRVDKIGQWWSRVVAEIRWTDDEGNSHFEQADGKLILRRPDELALAIGKFDEIMLWVGCDDEHYWLFQLRPPEGEPKTAYLGERGAGPVGPRRIAGLPVAPDQLMRLLAVDPLPAPDAPGVEIRHHQQDTVITLPADPQLAAARRRYVIDESTARPRVIELLNAHGDAVLTTRLTHWKPLTQLGKPPGAFPHVATRIDTVMPGEQFRLTLGLSDPTDGRKWDRIKDAQFDFGRLVKLLKVERVVRIHPQ